MHRSRIGVVLIDHPRASYGRAADFWAGATGSAPAATPPDDDPFQSLNDLPGGVHLALQRLASGTPRVHLDIETDDVPAEIGRVISLGARLVEQREGYAILADPGGLVFCVVPVQTSAEDFAAQATTWR